MSSSSTLSALLRRSDAAPALVSPQGVELASHQRLAAVVLSLAAQLKSAGIGKGDVVALAFPVSRSGPVGDAAAWSMLACLLAVTSIRAVAAPLDPSSTPGNLETAFGALQVMLVIVPSAATPSSSYDTIVSVAASLKVKTLALSAVFPSPPTSAPSAEPGFETLFDKYASQKGLGERLFEQRGRGRESREGDVAVAYLREGNVEATTQKDLIGSARQIVRDSSLQPSDRGSLSGLPLSSLAVITLLAASLASGGAVATDGQGSWSAVEGGSGVARPAAASVRALIQGRESKL